MRIVFHQKPSVEEGDLPGFFDFTFDSGDGFFLFHSNEPTLGGGNPFEEYNTGVGVKKDLPTPLPADVFADDRDRFLSQEVTNKMGDFSPGTVFERNMGQHMGAAENFGHQSVTTRAQLHHPVDEYLHGVDTKSGGCIIVSQICLARQ